MSNYCDVMIHIVRNQLSNKKPVFYLIYLVVSFVQLIKNKVTNYENGSTV
jgi:hypothetical protein